LLTSSSVSGCRRCRIRASGRALWRARPSCAGAWPWACHRQPRGFSGGFGFVGIQLAFEFGFDVTHVVFVKRGGLLGLFLGCLAPAAASVAAFGLRPRFLGSAGRSQCAPSVGCSCSFGGLFFSHFCSVSVLRGFFRGHAGPRKKLLWACRTLHYPLSDGEGVKAWGENGGRQAASGDPHPDMGRCWLISSFSASVSRTSSILRLRRPPKARRTGSAGPTRLSGPPVPGA
jgi:hypothetical protein